MICIIKKHINKDQKFTNEKEDYNEKVFTIYCTHHSDERNC